MARVARTLVQNEQEEYARWMDAYIVWESLRWTEPLAWQNLQDPLLRPALIASSLQFKVLLALVQRPVDICRKFADGLSWLMTAAAGSSLTVTENATGNIDGYGSLAQIGMVITAFGETLLEGKFDCVAARQLAHV
eukprot:CAMPEP_0117470238 /NCGR_PEP_ID=MMETSP0784-20121206/7108_1 /TAXON_ID=39447 /ORGANISM="" /LENGTH=135 /DNA_ID=CAMNT_0005264311 /DNA_START=14 /DNA_END=418 /DNA_ORIENTATION=+